ncbi:MAG: hypothetical protein AAF478_13205 [Pseudomonadota bacterium]
MAAFSHLTKRLELLIALYAIVIGSFFVFYESFLKAPVYDRWHDIGEVTWGASLMFVGALHIAALWLNGKNPKISRYVRVVACASHLVILSNFAVFFIQGGAIWGAITMATFSIIMLEILWSAVGELKDVWHGSRN